MDTEKGPLFGHDQCANYLEGEVGKLLLYPPDLNALSQSSLLKEVKPAFTLDDNVLMNKPPSKDEIKESLWSSNLNLHQVQMV